MQNIINKEQQQQQQVKPSLANNFEFYVVERISSPDDNPKDFIYKTSPVAFVSKAGLDVSNVLGFYLEEKDAKQAIIKQVDEVYARAKELEEKKMTVTAKLDKKIQEYQKHVENCMKRMKTEPEIAEKLQLEAETTLNKIKELRGKHKMVESSKKPLGEKKEFK